jgi:hypothetical protein
VLRFFAKILDSLDYFMDIILGIVASLIVMGLLLISLKTLLGKNKVPGIVEQRLDLALEVELIADAIERFANDEKNFK